jgi:hypothetical protein
MVCVLLLLLVPPLMSLRKTKRWAQQRWGLALQALHGQQQLQGQQQLLRERLQQRLQR